MGQVGLDLCSTCIKLDQIKWTKSHPPPTKRMIGLGGLELQQAAGKLVRIKDLENDMNLA